MAIEIEKKFLVVGDDWKNNTSSKIYFQGYICSGSGTTARVRIAGEKAFITIKGKHKGISRLEFEYEIPLEDAKILLKDICQQPIIHKRRYLKKFGDFLWEIDEFFGENEGLILAEIELSREDEAFPEPPWLGEDVTDDGRYYNASLRTNPFAVWGNKK
jgi:CYTH domain-containing protein